jgi:hypothetical protein
MRKILFAGLLSIAALAGCSKSEPEGTAAADNKANTKAEEAQLPTMTVDEVEKALAANEATAVDCNTDATRKRAGVVPGAVLVTDDVGYAASELPADKTKKLVFYCANPG